MTDTEADSPESARVIVPLEQDEDGCPGVGAERFWATHLSGAHYRLENSPFYAYDLSYEDVVEAIAEDESEHPIFVRLVEPSGRTTLCVIVMDDRFNDEIVSGIKSAGATVERFDETLLSVDLAPDVGWAPLRHYLQVSATERILDWEVGAFRHEGALDERLSPKVYLKVYSRRLFRALRRSS